MIVTVATAAIRALKPGSRGCSLARPGCMRPLSRTRAHLPVFSGTNLPIRGCPFWENVGVPQGTTGSRNRSGPERHRSFGRRTVQNFF
jgi:hypothetical protein